MRRSISLLLIELILASALLIACDFSSKTREPSKMIIDDSWIVRVIDVETRGSLTTKTQVKQYDGSMKDVDYDNEPSAGNIYCLINMSISKTAAGGSSFEWERLHIIGDDGMSYNRIEDIFLSNHGYDRLPGTDLQIGDNNGWICFELPQDVKVQKLIYETDDTQAEIEL